METNLLLFILHILTLLFSTALIYDVGSIFDFIVTYGKIYTLPDQKILIEPWFALPYHIVALCTFILAFTFIASKAYPYTLQQRSTVHLYIYPLAQGISLCICAAANVFCSVTAISMSLDVGKYANNAEPLEFQYACSWYFLRLRACAIFFGMNAFLNGAICVATYLGFQKEQYNFAKLSVISV